MKLPSHSISILRLCTTEPVHESSTCPDPRSPTPYDLDLPLTNPPTAHTDSNDGEIDQIDVEPASLSAVSGKPRCRLQIAPKFTLNYPAERKPDTPGTPVNRSPATPLDLPPPSLIPVVASIESKDSQKASKRTADAMLSGTPEAESAKRVKEAEGKFGDPHVVTICICLSLSVFFI
jgi:hypothetical protein